MQKYKFFVLVAIMLPIPLYAQSTSDPEEVVNGQQSRPEMPGLFFHKEQRRVLEAVRQGVVQEQDFDIEEFVPVVILEEILPEEIEQIVVGDLPQRQQRAQAYNFDAYVLNRKNGNAMLWLNGKRIDIEKDTDLLARQGIIVQSEEEDFGIKNGIFYGSDVYNSSNFEIKVGQSIGIDGGVEERLPVININKR